MLVKSHDGIGQYTMISVIVCMIDTLIMEWNSDLNPTDLDARTRSYGARKRCVTWSKSNVFGITFELCKPDITHLPRSRM